MAWLATCHARLSMAVLYLFKFYRWRPCASRQVSKSEDGLQVFAFNSQGGCRCEFVLELRDAVLLCNEEQGFESVCRAEVVADLIEHLRSPLLSVLRGRCLIVL
jgi:hypothetical protein